MHRGLVIPLGVEGRLCGILFSQIGNSLRRDRLCNFAACFFADE